MAPLIANVKKKKLVEEETKAHLIPHEDWGNWIEKC